MLDQLIVIPARMSGTRLPGKPLVQICGLPMIHHVWNRCVEVFDQSAVVVATEDQVIKDYCDEQSLNCIVTGKADSAIDRLKLVSDVMPAQTYLNVQGDEPLVNTADIKTISDGAALHPDRVIFGKVEATEEEFHDHSKAKVVCDPHGKLLYSSRAGIPLNNKGRFAGAERAIWIYAFPKRALDLYFEASDMTRLDQVEDNEIIRFLEIGVDVYCIDVIGDSWAVDEPKDIEVVEARLNAAKAE